MRVASLLFPLALLLKERREDQHAFPRPSFPPPPFPPPVQYGKEGANPIPPPFARHADNVCSSFKSPSQELRRIRGPHRRAPPPFFCAETREERTEALSFWSLPLTGWFFFDRWKRDLAVLFMFNGKSGVKAFVSVEKIPPPRSLFPSGKSKAHKTSPLPSPPPWTRMGSPLGGSDLPPPPPEIEFFFSAGAGHGRTFPFFWTSSFFACGKGSASPFFFPFFPFVHHSPP